MRKNAFLLWLTPILLLNFAFTATAQNYYPADIGNIWVLESSNGEERTTYSLEGPETIAGQELILLKVETVELSTGDPGDIDTDRYFLTVGDEAIKLHRTVLQQADLAVLTADFPTPVTFFPLQLALGDKWQIAGDAEAKLDIGRTLSGESTTDLEVVRFEDVVTPAGTFQNCAKIELAVNFTVPPFLTIDSTTYQWLAPDIGPVQYENSDGLRFSLVSSNLLPVPEEPEPTEEEVTPEPPLEEETTPEPVPYDVTGDGVVNVLDLVFVAARFGESNSDADVNGDGTVNILDVVSVAQNFSN